MSTLKKRLSAAAIAAGAALLMLPATGQAAQVFGSGLFHEPDEAGCEKFAPCTIAAFVEVPAEEQVSTAGAPIDGVITKFRIRAKVETTSQVTFRVVNIAQANDGEGGKSATATSSGTGPTVTLQTATAAAPPQEFLGRLPVRKGQRLAIDSPGLIFASYDPAGTKFSYEFGPPLVDGGGERASVEFLGELLVQGVIEPDADGDGFGDETQDGCPTQKTTQGACDRAKPAIAKLQVRKGKISYRLSEAATVSFRLAKKNARGKFKAVGRPFAGPGKAGQNRRGLPRAGKLRRGVYRLSATATDPAGNTGAKKTVFRIGG